MSRDELHRLIDTYRAAVHHRTVERKATVEAPDDVFQNLWISRKGIRIDGRHDTASAHTVDRDDDFADKQLPARPVTLVESGNAANDDIRAQPSPVATELSDRAVGSDEERQDIEPYFRVVVAYQ